MRKCKELGSTIQFNIAHFVIGLNVNSIGFILAPIYGTTIYY